MLSFNAPIDLTPIINLNPKNRLTRLFLLLEKRFIIVELNRIQIGMLPNHRRWRASISSTVIKRLLVHLSHIVRIKRLAIIVGTMMLSHGHGPMQWGRILLIVMQLLLLGRRGRACQRSSTRTCADVWVGARRLLAIVQIQVVVFALGLVAVKWLLLARVCVGCGSWLGALVWRFFHFNFQMKIKFLTSDCQVECFMNYLIQKVRDNLL